MKKHMTYKYENMLQTSKNIGNETSKSYCLIWENYLSLENMILFWLKQDLFIRILRKGSCPTMYVTWTIGILSLVISHI